MPVQRHLLERYIMFCPSEEKFYPNGVPQSLNELDRIIRALVRIRGHYDSEEEYEENMLREIREKWERDMEEAREDANYRPPPRKGFVYLMVNRRSGEHKIGFSKTPKVREANLRSFDPDIELLGFFPGTMKTEERLHFKYKKLRSKGEWFALRPEDISAIRSKFTTVVRP